VKLQFAISGMGIGGAERIAIELLRDSARQGDQVGLLAAHGPLDREIENLPMRRSALADSRSPLALAAAVGVATRFTHSFRPELVQAFNVRMTATLRAALQLAYVRRRPPLVSAYQGVPQKEVPAAARILRAADLVICPSEGITAQLEENGFPADRLAVVPNGVPDPEALSPERRVRLDAELGLDHDSEVVCLVARLAPQKRHDRFLEAVAMVRRHRPQARYLIVGDGPLRSELEALAAERGLDDVVVFTGSRSDATDLIARSDLMVLSSDWEGLSIAALEAGARGVPVISTDVAGAREVLRTGAGVIVPKDAEALAEAISAALADPDRRARMKAEALRLHRECFSVARMNAGYRELYEQLLRR
jgi:glycosyltransferase involved in cell wall biosynthesis